MLNEIKTVGDKKREIKFMTITTITYVNVCATSGQIVSPLRFLL